MWIRGAGGQKTEATTYKGAQQVELGQGPSGYPSKRVQGPKLPSVWERDGYPSVREKLPSVRERGGYPSVREKLPSVQERGPQGEQSRPSGYPSVRERGKRMKLGQGP